ncbi:DNA primase [Planctobacterium marinum]|uniref:DNA primase n=1 Tax=Planctobacterium marinum TaxID=1631968 RepID=A0AA48HNX0_9ALTE|nr:DNA primase [Planctobacterium marinum]
MAGRIPRSFIDDLLARADIVEVIDSYVRLKKAGRNYQACCPFHNEKSPSFTVAPDKQFYHCFGCGAHGNAISFLMEYERLEFPEAIEELARIYHLEVPREDGGSFRSQTPQQKQQLQDDYELMNRVARFYAQQLKAHNSGQQAIEYLKGRGLSGEIVKTFEIGFAPPDWDSVLRQFGSNEPAVQQLIDLKLVNQNDNQKRYDFFRDRITFPIRDRRGRVIGFGGRIMQGDGPKYLNSPETRIFHKGSELYGFYQAKQAHRKLDKVIIVEGYMDVVALAQFGIDYAVAALGTATTPEHIQLLFRNTQEVICCYDGDRAGRDAAWRALENALPMLKDGCQLKFLFLPDGEDPDTMVRQEGKEAFEQRLKTAQPLSEFLFEHLRQTHDPSTLEGKASLKAQAIPMLEKVPGEYQQQMLMEKLAMITGEYDRVVASKKIAEANVTLKAQKADYEKHQKMSDSPVRRLLHLLLHAPEVAKQVPEVTSDSLMAINLPGMNLVRDIHKICVAEQSVMGIQILERFREHPHYAVLLKMMSKEMPPGKDLVAEYRGNINRLIQLQLEARLDELTTLSRLQPLSAEEKQEIVALTKALRTGVATQ